MNLLDEDYAFLLEYLATDDATGKADYSLLSKEQRVWLDAYRDPKPTKADKTIDDIESGLICIPVSEHEDFRSGVAADAMRLYPDIKQAYDDAVEHMRLMRVLVIGNIVNVPVSEALTITLTIVLDEGTQDINADALDFALRRLSFDFNDTRDKYFASTNQPSTTETDRVLVKHGMIII